MQDVETVETEEVSESWLGLYLTLKLDGATYGVSLLKVQEIIAAPELSNVPCSPPFMRGLINLRGRVITVVDLRMRIGLPPVPDTSRTCIVLIEAMYNGQETVIGAVVDEVEAVIDVKAENYEDASSIGADLGARYLSGVAQMEDELILLFDINQVLGKAIV